MVSTVWQKIKEYGFESSVLLIVFSFTWLGFGDYMWGVLIAAFLFAQFFKQKRSFLYRDKLLLLVVLTVTLNNIISSLFAIDNPKTTLLSASFFIVLFIPMSYVRFALNRDNDFFIKLILPVSFFISLALLFYLYGVFIHHSLTVGLEFRRYTFVNLSRASTPDFLMLLAGLSYGWIRQKEGRWYPWLGLMYLIACMLGMLLAFDRGGVMAFFIMSIILLSFDVKRLLAFLVVIAVIVVLIMTVDVFDRLKRMIDYLYLEATRSELLEVQQISTFRAAWEMAVDHWLLGVGTNNFSKYSKLYGPNIRWAYAHNLPLQWWSENGIFGMLLNLSIVGIVIRRWLISFKKYRYKYVALGIGVSFIALFIGNLTNCTVYNLSTGIMFFLLAGLMSSIYFIVMDNHTFNGTE